MARPKRRTGGIQLQASSSHCGFNSVSHARRRSALHHQTTMLEEFSQDTRVVHCRKESYDVYIGRPSEYGNPYTHINDKQTKAQFVVKTREDAISSYRKWLLSQPEMLKRIMELDGKVLGCWCKPKSCHGDVIVEVINKIKTGEITP